MTSFRKKRNQGFTLIELLIVMSIIAILGTVAVTGYIGSTLKAARTEAYANLEALRMHEAQFIAENANYTNNLGNLPSFQPGPSAQFIYAINVGVALPAPPVAVPYNGATVGQATCFVATATGIANSRVANDVFAIDCNNNKNF
jgi:prepilin-type N-terminal cleavage/methylation domain-containing protein